MMKCENVEVLPIAKSNSNWKLATLALATLATMATFAKTFDVDISTGRPAASNEAYYHGETIEFRAVRGRSVVTNVEYSCVYYQTNGMDSVWWKTDGLVFHPTNDVGAASYRFFMEGREIVGSGGVESGGVDSPTPSLTHSPTISRDWHANGLLRLLPSPGFTPNTIELPVARLDFAAVDVLNPPWTDPDYSTNNTALVDTIEATAPAPGDYAAVSNAAVHAAITNALQDAAIESNRVNIASNRVAISTLSDSKLDKSGGTVVGTLGVAGPELPEFTVFEVVPSADGSAPTMRFSHAPGVVGLRWKIAQTSDGHDNIVMEASNELGESRRIDLPSASGTLALTSDIPTVPTEQINAATATNALQDAELESLSDSISTLGTTKADRSELAGYATPADLPYTLGSTITASATLADRTNNLVAPTNGNAAIVLTFPAAVSGKSRDFTALLSPGTNFSGSISFTVPSGATIYGDGFGATVAPGEAWLFSVTEIAAGTFYVSAIKMEAQ